MGHSNSCTTLCKQWRWGLDLHGKKQPISNHVDNSGHHLGICAILRPLEIMGNAVNSMYSPVPKWSPFSCSSRSSLTKGAKSEGWNAHRLHKLSILSLHQFKDRRSDPRPHSLFRLLAGCHSFPAQLNTDYAASLSMSIPLLWLESDIRERIVFYMSSEWTWIRTSRQAVEYRQVTCK